MSVDEKFNEECIKAHKEMRDLHGCPPLKFCKALAETAQKWANHVAHIGKLEHSPSTNPPIGENVAMKFVQGEAAFTGRQATCQWYSEIEDYDFSKENQMKCGHFSQVVWKESTEAGFGRARAADGKVFVVGQYTPPGNFSGKWRQNVPAPVNGKIYIPTKEDMMGPPTAPQIVKGGGGGKVSGGIQYKTSKTAGPKTPGDKMVGRSSKTKICSGVKTTVHTETYMDAQGQKYTVTSEESGKMPGGDICNGGGEEVVRPIRRQKAFAAPPGSSHNAQDDQRNEETNDPELEQFRNEVLDAHNRLRSKHGSNRLQNNTELDRLAQRWADTLCRKKQVIYSGITYFGQPVGENVAAKMAGGKPLTGELLVNTWYREEEDFYYGMEPTGNNKSRHFAQIVWQDTCELGVGKATDSDGHSWMVCYYSPPGNMPGQFTRNVNAP